MNRHTPEFDQRIADWLEVDPRLAPPSVMSTVLAALPSIPQARRGLLAPWRFSQMTSSMRAAAAVAIVAIVGVGVLALNSLSTDIGRPTPAPSASASAAPSVSFTSPLYGYTVDVPAGWAITSATVPWPERTTLTTRYMDSFASPRSLNPDFDNVFVAAQPVPDGMTSDDWLLMDAQQQAASARDCRGPVEDWVDATVGSLAIRRIDLECEGLRLSDVAFVLDGTGYAMSGNREVIAAFLANFRPGTPPVSFTSPLYGYTVDVPGDWGYDPGPATVQWPDGGLADTTHGEWFDVFPFDPTGQDIGFVGVAAQPIPDGMTADAWMLAFAERQEASSFACKGAVEDWVAAVVGTRAARRIDVTCNGEVTGEDFTGWRYAYVLFAIEGTGYLMNGGPEGLDALLDSFEAP